VKTFPEHLLRVDNNQKQVDVYFQALIIRREKCINKVKIL
jgi:hypothetical protein